MAIEQMGKVDGDFSDPKAPPITWSEASAVLEEAMLYWVTSVRPDGRPHTTPLIGIWMGGAAYFGTGPGERKARNLEANHHCILMTGCNSLEDGLDVVIEGEARLIQEPDLIRRVASAFSAKYAKSASLGDWKFAERDGQMTMDGNGGILYELPPAKVLAFAKGKGQFSQTRFAS